MVHRIIVVGYHLDQGVASTDVLEVSSLKPTTVLEVVNKYRLPREADGDWMCVAAMNIAENVNVLFRLGHNPNAPPATLNKVLTDPRLAAHGRWVLVGYLESTREEDIQEGTARRPELAIDQANKKARELMRFGDYVPLTVIYVTRKSTVQFSLASMSDRR